METCLVLGAPSACSRKHSGGAAGTVWSSAGVPLHHIAYVNVCVCVWGCVWEGGGGCVGGRVCVWCGVCVCVCGWGWRLGSATVHREEVGWWWHWASALFEERKRFIY